MKKKTVVALLLTAGFIMTACGNEVDTNSETVETTEESSQQITEEKDEENIETDAKENAEGQEKEDVPETKEESAEVNEGTTEETTEENSQEDTETAQKSGATFQTLADSKLASDGTEIYKYMYTYPTVYIVGNEEATNKIVADQELKKQNFMEEVNGHMSGVEDSYRTLMESEFSDEFFGPGYDIIEYEFKFLKGNLLSFSTRNSSYCIGGAHGNTQIKGITYDITTGDILDLGEIFEGGDGVKDIFQEMIISKAKSEGILAYEPDEFMLEDIAEMTKENYWFFAEDGLHFIANEYVFTGLGEYQDFVFSYEELPEMKDNYKL